MTLTLTGVRRVACRRGKLGGRNRAVLVRLPPAAHSSEEALDVLPFPSAFAQLDHRLMRVALRGVLWVEERPLDPRGYPQSLHDCPLVLAGRHRGVPDRN